MYINISRKLSIVLSCVFGIMSMAIMLELGIRPSPVYAQNASSTPIVYPEEPHAISQPLSALPAAPEATPSQGAPYVIPLLRRGPVGAAPQGITDPASIQTVVLPLILTTNLLNFDGIAYSANPYGLVPPSPNSAVGATQVFETVNISYQIFNKSTGGSVAGPNLLYQIWTNLYQQYGTVCGTPTNAPTPAYYSDPEVLYDPLASRWLVTVIASYSSAFTTGTECIAVSTTSDATGTFYLYQQTFSYLNDAPKFGVWPDGYYASYNMWNTSTDRFLGAQVCAYNRTAMLAGNTQTPICFQRTNADYSFLPSDIDGTTAPPSGEPNFFVELVPNSALDLYTFHVDFGTPSNSTFTGPTSITVASFAEACYINGTCIPQYGTSQQLDSLGDRLMPRLAYRNFGDHEALVANHSVTAGSSVGVRWYEIRSPNSTPTLYQQGTYAPDSAYRWMGSIAMDKSGDIAVGYSASSASIYPQIRYSGRVPSDPLGTLEPEDYIMSGFGYQGGYNRWGDYTSMAVDPVDGCTFWITNEYYAYGNSGTTNWSTRLASFQFFNCTPTPSATVSPTRLNFTSKYDQQVTLTDTLTNNGPGTLSIYSIEVTGDSSFSLNSTLCTSSLPQGQSCWAKVTFAPQGCLINVTGQLVFSDNGTGGEQTVSLTGRTIACPPAPAD